MQRETALATLLKQYIKDRGAKGPHATQLAFAHRRKDVFALNQAIRRVLRSWDEPAPETLFMTETGSRAFARGDRMIFTRNDKQVGVKNGTLGKVESADADSITVLLDSADGTAQRLAFDPRHYRSFDHGYAVTIHKSQGATVDRAYVLVSRTMDMSLAYVAMTRHRESLHLYLSGKDRPSWAAQENDGHQRWAIRARRLEQS